MKSEGRKRREKGEVSPPGSTLPSSSRLPRSRNAKSCLKLRGLERTDPGEKKALRSCRPDYEGWDPPWRGVRGSSTPGTFYIFSPGRCVNYFDEF